MKFEAKKTDLLLELTTLKGEELNIDCNAVITANKAAAMIKKIADMDIEIRNDPDNATNVVKILAGQLDSIYGKGVKWWSDNFDFPTLIRIKAHVLGSLSGLKKNVEN